MPGRFVSIKRLAPILILAGAIPGVAPAVEWGLPWFHTRAKPVLLDDRGAQPVSQKMVKRTDYRTSGQDETTRPVWTDTRRSHEIFHKATSRSSSQTNPTH
jgi:hypothetical protein